MKITLTIDGKSITAEENQMLVDVAADNDVYIPTLCYQRGKPCLGTCRVCTCKVNGNNAASCTVPVTDGMVAEVNEPETRDIRKALIEMLFVEGKHNCPSCEKSGRCDLQAVGYETGMMVSRFPYRFPVTQADFQSKKIWLERDRCIFCQRCVEFVRDRESGQKIFNIHGRGADARIDIDIMLADKMPDEQVVEAMELCPVGCILKKGVGFDAPIGRRKFEIASVRDRVTGSDGK
ncbi:2Fe-2S iron-sulfur cluster-binding protein [Enterovibrio sp. ZSDZ35]|uniref:NADH-quinone oxidoreductase subunit G n=1 Tax=Enterovibrio qingdaonensis TaxID=2899818 RepID=A0ABT5QIA0_9GAMM|nr:2Fe-2S iron-sulfur cluster-binding protein [Enterovibrio sp. ZSDZ35]MDD1780712.1 2Fe-2S iron-sulfur cluster-binding protein [Enterovibrio sp. ZSDZ35]